MKEFLKWEAEHNVNYGDSDAYRSFKQKEMIAPFIEIEIDSPNWRVVDDWSHWYYGGQQGPHALSLDFGDELPADIRKFFLYKKDGKRKLRWLFHPLDTQKQKQIQAYLKERKIPFTFYKIPNKNSNNSRVPVSDVKVHSTASKSFIVQLPNSERSFSYKTSTNKTIQMTEDRPNPSRWSYFARRINEHALEQQHQFKHMTVAWESGAVALPPLRPNTDHSFQIRLMEDVSKNKLKQMTGFVFADKDEVARIARLAGQTPEDFVKEASRYFGAFLAELNLIVGFSFGSAHLQNIRFELDKNYKLTGRVVWLDITDGAPIRAIMEPKLKYNFLPIWEKTVANSEVMRDRKTYNNPFPNKIIEDGNWRQQSFLWTNPFDLDEFQNGFLKRASEIGDFADGISFDKNGNIFFKFGKKDELLSRFKKKYKPSLAPTSCHKSAKALLRSSP